MPLHRLLPYPRDVLHDISLELGGAGEESGSGGICCLLRRHGFIQQDRRRLGQPTLNTLGCRCGLGGWRSSREINPIIFEGYHVVTKHQSNLGLDDLLEILSRTFEPEDTGHLDGNIRTGRSNVRPDHLEDSQADFRRREHLCFEQRLRFNS